MNDFVSFKMILFSNFMRYGLQAGVFYLIFYVWKRRHFLKRKIQQRFPGREDIAREVGYSLLTLLIFACVGYGMVWASRRGWTQMYFDFGEHSTGYFWLSVAGLILFHDTYFYWTHRLMHWRAIFKYVHLVHHRSTNPTPWAAFAFHPTEAVIEAGVLPLAGVLFPFHPLAIVVFLFYMTLLNVIGHLGFEVFPKKFTRSPLTFWHNTSTHHNMHHQFFNCNYGLYFNFWDRLMGTNHEHYHEAFDRVREADGAG